MYTDIACVAAPRICPPGARAKMPINSCASPKDRPLASALLLGFTKARRPIHAVLPIDEEDEMLWVITVYEPTLVEWRDGFKERRVEDDMSTM